MSIKYEMIIYQSNENNAFIVKLPELPGCTADGQTYQGAFANGETIIKERIETAKDSGRFIPGPKGELIYV